LAEAVEADAQRKEAAAHESAAATKSRRRKIKWLTFWTLFAAASIAVWTTYSHKEAIGLVVCAITLMCYAAFVWELVMDGKWWRNRKTKQILVRQTKNPVLSAKADFDKALAEYLLQEDRQRRDFWKRLDGLEFEHELARALREANYVATVTRGSGDDGVDIWAEKDGETIAIQCKRYEGAVGPAVVRELYGVLMHLEAARGIVATTGYFTGGAISFVEDKPIELWTLDEILHLQSAVQKAPSGQAAENQ